MKAEQVALSATIEKTLSVSGLEPFTVAVRSRTPARPEPTMTVEPSEVTLAYAFRRGDWVLTGAEVFGSHADPSVPYFGRAGLVRFVVGVHEDMPSWLLSLAASYEPVNPPG